MSSELQLNAPFRVTGSHVTDIVPQSTFLMLNIVRSHVVANSLGRFPHQGRVRAGAGREGDNSDEENKSFHFSSP